MFSDSFMLGFYLFFVFCMLRIIFIVNSRFRGYLVFRGEVFEILLLDLYFYVFVLKGSFLKFKN